MCDPSSASGRAGSTCYDDDVMRPKPMNSKQRKSKKFWESQRAMKKIEKAANLASVERPQNDPKNEGYFNHSKQLNMGFTDMWISREKSDMINLWTPNDSILSEHSFIGIYGKESSLKLVDDDLKFDEMMMDLVKSQEIAIDLEGHMEDTYLGMTALIQIASYNCDYILDPFPLYTKIVEELKPKVFENPDILKIVHGAGASDVPWLIRDFGSLIIGGLDTQLLYNLIRDDEQNNLVSFRELSKIFCDFEIQKEQQLSDWRRRPLTPFQLEYARHDVHVLLRIWNNMRQEIHSSYDNPKTMLEDAMRLTATTVLLKSYKERKYPNAMEDLRKFGIGNLDAQNLPIYELLHQWRDRYARIVDTQPERLLETKSLIKISQNQPKEQAEILRMMGSRNRNFNILLESQVNSISRIIHDKNSFIQRLHTLICNNCLQTGHFAIHCPFEKDVKRSRNFFKTLATEDQRNHENKRKKDKYEANLLARYK